MPEACINICLMVGIVIIGLLSMVAVVMIKPNGKYHCHISGCYRSFDTLDELIQHFDNDHNLSNDLIEEIREEYKILRHE